jgi:hypothetical protein
MSKSVLQDGRAKLRVHRHQSRMIRVEVFLERFHRPCYPEVFDHGIPEKSPSFRGLGTPSDHHIGSLASLAQQVDIGDNCFAIIVEAGSLLLDNAFPDRGEVNLIAHGQAKPRSQPTCYKENIAGARR